VLQFVVCGKQPKKKEVLECMQISAKKLTSKNVGVSKREKWSRVAVVDLIVHALNCLTKCHFIQTDISPAQLCPADLFKNLWPNLNFCLWHGEVVCVKFRVFGFVSSQAAKD